MSIGWRNHEVERPDNLHRRPMESGLAIQCRKINGVPSNVAIH